MTAPAPYQDFLSLPSNEPLTLAWPTPNRHLFAAPDRYFARTRANPDYGQPGWTRDCGKRFHRGCDIAPLAVAATGELTRVIFTDCASGQDFPGDEPVLVPHDEVFGVADGVVEEVVTDETTSDFGRHVVVVHRWPRSGESFATLYAHLAEVRVALGQPLARGTTLGRMGRSSRSADARNWMAIAPHLHFEARAADGRPYDPVLFLRAYLPR